MSGRSFGNRRTNGREGKALSASDAPSWRKDTSPLKLKSGGELDPTGRSGAVKQLVFNNVQNTHAKKRGGGGNENVAGRGKTLDRGTTSEAM